MSTNFRFPRQAFVRQCPSCGWGVAASDEADETPPPTYCPRCGIELEIMACAACGAPVQYHTEHVVDDGIIERRTVPERLCRWCGEAPTRSEPQLRLRGGGLEQPRRARRREDA